MRDCNWLKELDGIFSQVESIKEDLEKSLRIVYNQRDLAWDGQVIKNLSGDIHSKVLGAYVRRALKKNGIEADLSYEVTLHPTRLRADIVVDRKITVESKAQGIFSLTGLRKRWQSLNQARPDLIHILVSWRHNPSYVRQIREFIPESQHYYFHNLLTHENQPQELERLIKNIESWVKLSDNRVKPISRVTTDKQLQEGAFRMKSRLGKSYRDRPYMFDFKTGEELRTTVMYDNNQRVAGTGRVIDVLRLRLLDKAAELGGKNLKTRDFIDAFRIRGPKYGDVVRQVISELENQGKISKRNSGTKKKPKYVYDVV
jgi:hypothetical protein